MIGKLALKGARHVIWDQIIAEANKFKPYIDFIAEQEKALTKAKKKVLMVLGEVQKRPVVTTENFVALLSSLPEDMTNRYNIQNRVAIISRARKVIAKHRMLDTVQAKIDIIEHKVKEVIQLFKPLVDRGIPFFWEEKGPLLSQKEYLEHLVSCQSDNNKFRDMQQSLSGRTIFDKLASEFELLFDFKVTYAKSRETPYPETMEFKVQAFDMVVATLPGPDQWRSIQQYGSSKFKTQP